MEVAIRKMGNSQGVLIPKPILGATDAMAGKIPGATRVVIDGAGHASNIDRPREFNADVTEFLAKL